MADPRFISPITVLAQIKSTTIDVTNRIGETYNNIITQNPIEDGSPTTDHITNLPPEVTIEGGFSDISISKLIGPAVTQQAIRGRAKTEFDKLLNLYTKKEAFTVVDGFHLFKNMQFKSLQLQKDRPGYSIFFTAQLVNIIIIDLNVTTSKVESEADISDRIKVVTQGLLPVGPSTEKVSGLPSGVLR